MAGQAVINIGMQIDSGNLHYPSGNTSFIAVVTGSKGPTPGALTVYESGTDADLSQLVQPGLCKLTNLDQFSTVEWGVWDPLLQVFHSVGELLPGEWFLIRLSRFFGEDLGPTSGTGTVGMGKRLRFRALDVESCDVLVEAFET